METFPAFQARMICHFVSEIVLLHIFKHYKCEKWAGLFDIIIVASPIKRKDLFVKVES